MVSENSNHIILLIQQSRFKEADKLLEAAMELGGLSYFNFALRAICNLELKNYDFAYQCIQSGLELNAGDALLHSLACSYFMHKGDIKNAEYHIKEAIEINPEEADYFANYASIKMMQNKWSEAIELVDNGLALQPDNLSCLNIKTTALTKLKRHTEAERTIENALGFDPNNAATHTNVGWRELEKRNYQKSLEAFSTALAINPNSQYAKEGLTEALKAKYWFYKLFLAYVFWLSRLDKRTQGFFIFGIYILIRVMRYVAESIPAIETPVFILVIAYSIFAVSTWVINPITNLIFRFNKYGKHLLNREEITATNYSMVSLIAALVNLLLFFTTQNFSFLIGAIGAVALLIPISRLNASHNQKQNNLAQKITWGIFGLYVLMMVAIVSTSPYIVEAIAAFGISIVALQLFWNVKSFK